MAIQKENYRFFNMRNFRIGHLAGRAAEMARLKSLGVIPDIGAPTGVFEYTGDPQNGAVSTGVGTVCYPLLAEQVVFLIELLSVAWCPWVPYNEAPDDENSTWWLGLSSVSGAALSMCRPVKVPDSDSPVTDYEVYGWRLPTDNNSGIIVFHRDRDQHQESSQALIGHNGIYRYDNDSDGYIQCASTWADLVRMFVNDISAESAGDVSIWCRLYSQENS